MNAFTASTCSLALTLTLMLGGCANMSAIEIGSTETAVRATLGAPTTQTKTGTGVRWTYSTAPEGKETWLFEFDASGRLVSRVQALTMQRVAQVQNGLTQAEVEALIGPSYGSLRYPTNWDELVHVYRFNDVRLPLCFYVGYDKTGTVTSSAMQEELNSTRRIGRPC